MTRAEILALIQEMARDQADDDTIAVYYDETVAELGKTTDPPMVNCELLSVTDGTSTYDYPDRAVRLMWLFYEGYQLSKATEHELEAYEPTWRDDESDPVSYKTDHETAREVRFYPIPGTTSGAFIPPVAQPLGEDMPADMVSVIYSDNRATAIPDFIALYLVFQVLYREFIRPSDHQDTDWANMLKKIAGVLYQMGVNRRLRDDEVD